MTITRGIDNHNRKIARVTSPNGRGVEFTYLGTTWQVAEIRDNIGRVVSYTYATNGVSLMNRLSSATDPAGGVTEYTYNADHRMLTVRDSRNIVYLTNEYDAAGRITRQTQADGTTYQFAYTLDENGKIIQTDVTDPRGNLRRVTFNGAG